MKRVFIYDFSEIGHIIYRARINKGYTQSQLAALCNESNANLSNIENGKRLNLTINRIMKIIKHLDIELQFIVYE